MLPLALLRFNTVSMSSMACLMGGDLCLHPSSSQMPHFLSFSSAQITSISLFSFLLSFFSPYLLAISSSDTLIYLCCPSLIFQLSPSQPGNRSYNFFKAHVSEPYRNTEIIYASNTYPLFVN